MPRRSWDDEVPKLIGYMALFTTNAKGNPVEVSTDDTGYVRQKTTYQLDRGFLYVNEGVRFAATQPWGAITYCGLCKKQAGGKPLIYFKLNETHVVAGEYMPLPRYQVSYTPPKPKPRKPRPKKEASSAWARLKEDVL